MGSITQSPDRVAQVLSGSAVQQGAGDSALQPADSNPLQVVEQAFTGVSAAELVYESRQQYSSVSEGVASAGNPPQLSIDRMDEFVPAGAIEPPVSAAVGCEGETSGGNYAADPAGGSNGYGELAETGDIAAGAAVNDGSARVPPASPMDFQTTASGHAGPSPIGKRKSSFEVSDFQEPKRPEGINRCPSDLAMVTGLSDGEAGEPVEAPQRRPMDATDSNVAGILAGVAAAPTLNEGETAEAMFMPITNQPSTAAGGGAGGAATTSMPPPPPVVPQVATIAGGEAVTQGGGATAVGGIRPTDADIIAWENRIKEEEVRNIPLIGDVEPLQALEAEYRSGNDIFLAKIAALRRGYSAIRRTRGDGNCFFRSFVFAYLEQILRTGDLAERDRAVERLNGIKQVLLNAGYEELVLESPLELLLAMLRSIGSPSDPLTLEALEGNMKAEDVSNYVVFLLRMATSAEVKRRADFFAPFIMVRFSEIILLLVF
jgi:Peptidase C65 Otubain